MSAHRAHFGGFGIAVDVQASIQRPLKITLEKAFGKVALDGKNYYAVKPKDVRSHDLIQIQPKLDSSKTITP